MNFFKKVITFFSAIWNAILWRKSDKKAKQATIPAETADPVEESSNPTSETDKLFVDIPLHPSEATDSYEQVLLTREKIPQAFTQPVVAHNIELHSGLDPGIRKYSSGVHLFGFEDQTSPTLSFFSEPLRDDSELPVHTITEEKEKAEIAGNQSAISQIGRESDHAAEVVKDDQARDVLGLSASDELPSPPNEPIPEEAEQLKSNADIARDLTSKTPPITSLNDKPQLEALHFSVDDLESFPSNRSFTFTKGKINPDLNDLAIGDDIHLFDHDVTDILPNLEESVNNERAHVDEAAKLGRDVQTLPIMNVTENDFNNIECNQTIATSCPNEASFGISVSTQAIVDTQEHTTESSSKYSTNYLVKSDSLVNFFPEVGLDVNENAGVEIEAGKKSVTHKEEQLPSDYNVSVKKEGDMEEIMCTPKGVLKLSGDHVDLHEEINFAIDAKLCHNVKTAVDDFLMDAFAFEEPLLITHLEGNVIEDTPDISLDPPISQSFQGAVESELDGGESVDELDTLTNDEFLIENDAISRCRSFIREGPISPTSRIVSRNGSPKEGRDEEEENKKTLCKLNQFTTFHLDDEPKCVGNSKNSNIIAPAIPSGIRGELPAGSRLSKFLPTERDTSSTDQTIEGNSTELFLTGQQNDIELLDDPEWSVNIALTGLEEVTGHETSPNYLHKQAGSVLGIDEKANRNFSMDQDSHSGGNENVNDYYPFIDCSSYLFRIPKEIRKEPTFNPCVGAAPSRRSSYTSNAYIETSGYDVEHNAYRDTYSNMNSMVPTCAGTVPLINTCIPEEYKNATIEKVPDDYSNRHVSHEIGTFWGGHPGLEHPMEEQQAIVGYPVSCNENYYDDNDLNVMPTTAYETDQTNMCANPERYGYASPYGAVQFPMLSIPFCNPQSQSAYMPRGTLAPLMFPIGSMNSSENENPPPVINLHATPQSERFSIHQPWEAHLQNDDEEREIVSLVGGMTPIENLSCTSTNDDDEDDLDNNPIPDQYLLLAENNSLHTVKSKADSYSGSLFCESLRSLISHNTENENIFPSFSCSSVQGCCPSIVLQSCETTVSSDSLPSIIVEETSYSRSVDEDYLATEKFMNDVNTALNESVLDQIQGQGDLHSNLLGRGDGSLSIGPGQSGNEGRVETSLGENISINNSKLTLFDGILGLDGGGNEQEQHIFCEFEGESSSSAFFREVVETIVEGVITTSLATPTPAPEMGVPETHADCREYLEENGNQRNPDRDLVVQSMMFIEGLPTDEVRLGCRGYSRPNIGHQDNKVNVLPLEQLLGELYVPKMSIEAAFNNAGDANIELASVVDNVHNKKGRRNRRRRKKLSDVDSEIEPDPSTNVPGGAVGDTVGKNPLELNSDRVEDVLPSSSEARHTLGEPAVSEADGEKFTNKEKEESPVGEQELQQFEDEGDGHQEEGEETGENSSNPSNNRRRRNRRRKRRN